MTYDYFCTGCGSQVEIIHGMFDEVTYYCETCNIELTKGAPRKMNHVYYPWRARQVEEGRW